MPLSMRNCRVDKAIAYPPQRSSGTLNEVAERSSRRKWWSSEALSTLQNGTGEKGKGKGEKGKGTGSRETQQLAVELEGKRNCSG